MNTQKEIVWLQASLNLVLGSDLALDGLMGPKTSSVFLASPPEKRDAIILSGASLGVSSPLLTGSGRVPLDAKWLTHHDLRPLYRKAEAITGFPARHMESLVEIEAASQTVAGDRFFDVQSKSGSFAGLTQMGAAAWEDASAWLDGGLPPYEEAKYDPYWSILGAAAYNQRWTFDYKRSSGNDPQFAVRYAVHNQGPAFFRRARSGLAPVNFFGQSPLARQLLEIATREVA